MTRKIVGGVIGGLVIIGLAARIVSQWSLQPTMSETAAAVIEPTAAPTETTASHEDVATYRNEDFGFTLQYPTTVPCFDERDGETCTVRMSPRDLSSIGVRESVVFYLESHELSFSVAIEKKLPNFTSLLDLVQYRNEHLNDEINDPLIIIKNVRQMTWQGYPAIASDEEYKGRLECTLHVEKETYLYRLMFPYPCPLLNEAGVSDIPKNDPNEQKKITAIEMILNQFIFDKGEH